MGVAIAPEEIQQAALSQDPSPRLTEGVEAEVQRFSQVVRVPVHAGVCVPVWLSSFEYSFDAFPGVIKALVDFFKQHAIRFVNVANPCL